MKSAIEMIRSQQGERGTDVWMVGQQLIDIIEREPETAPILAEDLQNEGMSIKAAAAKLQAHADEIAKKRRCGKSEDRVCIPPDGAEQILRKFYGLPEQKETPAVSSGILDLEDFL